MIKYLPHMIITFIIILLLVVLSDTTYAQTTYQYAPGSFYTEAEVERMIYDADSHDNTLSRHTYGRVDSVQCTTDFDGRTCCGVIGVWECEK